METGQPPAGPEAGQVPSRSTSQRRARDEGEKTETVKLRSKRRRATSSTISASSSTVLRNISNEDESCASVPAIALSVYQPVNLFD